MPLYEYQCHACGQRFEQIRKFSDPPLTVCQHCGAGPVEKLISTPAIQFKGSGFYITDYAKSGGASEKPGTKDASGSADASGETAKPAASSEKSKSDTAAPAAAAPAKADRGRT